MFYLTLIAIFIAALLVVFVFAAFAVQKADDRRWDKPTLPPRHNEP